MLQLYLFCLVLAGGLAVLSVFGDLADTDLVDADLELDGDIGTDVDSGFDWARIFSLRGFLYTVFGFGLAGSLQVWLLDAAPAAPITVVSSAVAGLATGWIVDRLTDAIRGASIPDRADDGFQGCSARVLVPIREDAPGRIRVMRGGRSYDVRALPHGSPDSDPTTWEHVVVLETEEGIARVVPEDVIELEPGEPGG